MHIFNQNDSLLYTNNSPTVQRVISSDRWGLSVQGDSFDEVTHLLLHTRDRRCFHSVLLKASEMLAGSVHLWHGHAAE